MSWISTTKVVLDGQVFIISADDKKRFANKMTRGIQFRIESIPPAGGSPTDVYFNPEAVGYWHFA